ncbi:hypothetical protein TNCV_569511 [Trichonephila clavipes]|nr:hypothetical protein TNCV_569511 [Trichonephila clavipes]
MLALLALVSCVRCDVNLSGNHGNKSNIATEDTLLVDVHGWPNRPLCISIIVPSVSNLLQRTATAGSDVVQSGRLIIDDFFQHLWPYIGNNTANVVFQMVKRLWLIRIDQ